MKTVTTILKNTEFRDGTTSDAELLKYFSDAVYYVSPGAVGLGVLHSFAYGVPVLTMEGPGHGPEVSNIRNGVNGQVFCDEADIRNNLIKFLALDTAKEMGRNAFVHYNKVRNIENMVDDFIKALYESGYTNE